MGLLSDVIDFSDDAILAIDPDSARFLDVNAGACALLGYTKEELLQLRVPDLSEAAMPPDAWEKIAARARAGPQRIQTVHRRKDGSTYVAEVHTRLVEQEGRKIFVAVARDISERARLNDELRRSYTMLLDTQLELVQKAKLTALGEMASGVAHELNQPLNNIKLTMQAILLDLEKNRYNPADLPADCRSVVELVDSMATTIEHLRAFVRKPEKGIVEHADVNGAINGALGLVGQQLSFYDIQVKQQLAWSLPVAVAEQHGLEQVFVHLLTNARDAIFARVNDPTEGTPLGKVMVKSYADDEHVYAEIEDNGIGISSTVEGKLFEPFFTTKEPGKGVGLGLAISRRIVEECGGRIELRPHEGPGAAFRVVLRVAPSSLSNT